MSLKGGYIVQPVPAPKSHIEEVDIKKNEGTNNQKLKLFNLGKDISGEAIIIGKNQLPKPPIIIGIIKKKIMRIAWVVTIELYTWLLKFNIEKSGEDNSNLIIIEYVVPIIPANIPNIKYQEPITLWFVDIIHLLNHK